VMGARVYASGSLGAVGAVGAEVDMVGHGWTRLDTVGHAVVWASHQFVAKSRLCNSRPR